MEILDYAEKRTINGEIIVTLFEQCNLACRFCPQDHSSREGLYNIKEKKDYIIKAILNLKKAGRTQFSVHLMGGEVFSDLIEKSTFKDYYDLVSSLFEWAHRFEISLEVAFTTNLVFSDYKRVDELMARLFLLDSRVYLMTSYDPHSRFNNETFSVFKKNVRELNHWIRTVNVIMTKPAINKFLSYFR